MSYAIVGFGRIGQALAHSFARKNINVTVASRRPPEELAPQARAIGPTVIAKSLQDALEADTIFLAVPFGEHREIAKALPNWKGKTIIDAMNVFGKLVWPTSAFCFGPPLGRLKFWELFIPWSLRRWECGNRRRRFPRSVGRVGNSFIVSPCFPADRHFHRLFRLSPLLR
jgi:hypothetical protein